MPQPLHAGRTVVSQKPSVVSVVETCKLSGARLLAVGGRRKALTSWLDELPLLGGSAGGVLDELPAGVLEELPREKMPESGIAPSSGLWARVVEGPSLRPKCCAGTDMTLAVLGVSQTSPAPRLKGVWVA